MDFQLLDPFLCIAIEFVRKGNIWERPKDLKPAPRLGHLEEILYFIPRTEAIKWVLALSELSDALEIDRKRARVALVRHFGYTGSRNSHGM